MKASLAGILACPAHRAPLRLEAFASGGDEVEEGLLVCETGGDAFPVWGGIPRMLVLADLDAPSARAFLARHGDRLRDRPDALGAVSADQRATADSFAFQWRRFGSGAFNILDEAEEREAFDDLVGTPEGGWAGKRVLDAGCGPGWYAERMAGLGASVVGIDLSRAVEPARARRPGGNPAYVQGDLTRLPFRDAAFDYVYCYSVLQHTSDTRAVLGHLARTVTPGGTVAVTHYGPIRYVRWFYDLARVATTRMPVPLLYALSHLAVPLAHVPLLRHACFPSNYPRRPRRRRVLDTFDWYHPRTQRYTTQEEMLGWLREAGLVEAVSGLKLGPTALRALRPR